MFMEENFVTFVGRELQSCTIRCEKKTSEYSTCIWHLAQLQMHASK